MHDLHDPVDLYCSRQGDGPPLLILHGLYGSGANWNSHAKWLSQDFSVVLVDLRNHGRSPHAPDTSYEAMAADLAALLDRLELEQAVVLGHSMGGKAAMTLALTWPERVRALIVADIAPLRYDSDQGGHDNILRSLRGLDLASIDSRSAADEALAANISTPMVRQFLLTNLQGSPDGYRWRIPLDTLYQGLPSLQGFPELAGRYDGPTLILHGGDSDYVKPEAEPVFRRYFPAAQIAEVPGAGHWLHVEKPDAFAEKLREFLVPFK